MTTDSEPGSRWPRGLFWGCGAVVVLVALAAALLTAAALRADPRDRFVIEVTARAQAGAGELPASVRCLQAAVLAGEDGGRCLSEEGVGSGAGHWPGPDAPPVGWGKLRDAGDRAAGGCAEAASFATALARSGPFEAAAAGARLLQDVAGRCEAAPPTTMAAAVSGWPATDQLLWDAQRVRELRRFGHLLTEEQRESLSDAVAAYASDPDLVACAQCLPFKITDWWEWSRRLAGSDPEAGLPNRTVARLREAEKIAAQYGGRD